ncbi:MAG: hypothetical protein K6F69_10590 [Treponema sp.]|nr:hypothetical protein [Treponema sp.]
MNNKTNFKTNKCEEIMNTFMLLDKDEHIPLKVTAHLLCCKKCRSQVRLLTKAERITAAPLNIQTPITDKSLQNIMEKVNKLSPSWQKDTSVPNPITMKGWVVSGILMIILMLTFGLFTPREDSTLMIAFYLVFAAIITAYCAVFIGSNIDFFVKKISTTVTTA